LAFHPIFRYAILMCALFGYLILKRAFLVCHPDAPLFGPRQDLCISMKAKCQFAII